jgi:hypothetical protein
MNTRRRQWIAVPLVMAAVGLCLSAAAAAPPGDEGLTVEQLALKGATVKFQVDVNGDAAMQLLGGILDAAAEVAQQQAATANQAGPMAQMAMAEPFIGPTKDMLKSLSRVTVLVMQAGPEPKDVVTYYGDMMIARGWSALATTRAITGQDAAVYLAPGGKGVFVVARPNGEELIVALVTTHQPIGDLLGQIVRAGGTKALPMILAAKSKPAPKEECKQALTEPSEPAEPAE